MATTEAFEALKEYLIQNHRAKVASGGREIIKRCHICGDSRDQSDAHMYIGMNNGVIVYNCFKCNAGGVVDGKFLRDMDCYDTGIISIVQEQNTKSGVSNSSNSGGVSSYNKRVMVIPFVNNAFGLKKLDYLKRRLGIPYLDQNMLISLKVILNLKEFLNANGITEYTRDPGLVDLLDKFFIGFLSADNSYVILRRLVPEGKLPEFIDTRYVNYNIFGRDTGMKFYFIPNQICPYERISIHIAEGCFDILSIAYNLPRTVQLGTNDIFAAVCGKSYSSLIKYFISTFGFMSFDLHLYPDNDVDDREMRWIAEEFKAFNIFIYIHRNQFPGEKDFGVDKDHIQEYTYQIK